MGIPFLVNGLHTYADSHVNGGAGKYAIVVNIDDEGYFLIAAAVTIPRGSTRFDENSK